MKKFLVLLLFVSVFLSKSLGTIQRGDLLIMGHDTILIHQFSFTVIGRDPDERELIFADWFSGSFSISMREKREIWESWNFGHLFMRQKKIKILEGVIS